LENIWGKKFIFLSGEERKEPSILWWEIKENPAEAMLDTKLIRPGSLFDQE
jgi:hypothetical protein